MAQDFRPDLRIKSYVLRSGRMTSAQLRAYESLGPAFRVPFQSSSLDFAALFGNDNPVLTEIGFGMGAATARIAAENPAKNYLGIEVYRPGIGRLLSEIENRGLSNIRIVEHDAAEVLPAMIPPASLEGVHIFFPDPWPKKRHHKRRLVKRPFTDLLAEKLRPGGYVYMVTDWAEYAEEALEELMATEALTNSSGGFTAALPWRPQTEFERKGLEKRHEVRELYFVRRSF